MTRTEALMEFQDNSLNLGSMDSYTWFCSPMPPDFQQPIDKAEFAEETRIGLEVLALTRINLPFGLGP